MRKKSFYSVLLVAFLLFVNFPFSTDNAYAESSDNEVRELIIKYVKEDDSDKSRMTQSIEEEERITSDVKLLKLKDGVDHAEVQSELEKNPAVEYVEPNYQRKSSYVINDTYYSGQWWAPHVKAESIWLHNQSQQESTVVAVIDSGIDFNHEDLKNRIASGGYNFYSNSTNYSDYDGHGTNVSGVIAAQSGNGRGISGIAGPYDVSILPLKVSNLGKSYVSDIVKAIDHAILHNVDVINLSLGGDQPSITENNAIQRAAQAGISIVASAGNEAQLGNPISYPASYSNVISVGSVNEQNQRSNFSNYNGFVDLVAPGENILTTFPYQGYNGTSGTSFSAPIVAGTVAMMKGIEPELSNSEIDDLLRSTATDLGAPGYDPFYGDGLLNIEALAEELIEENTEPIAVTGVNLDTDYVFMDMQRERDSFTFKEEHLEQLDEARSNSSIFYEQEPNNNFNTANVFSLNNGIVGSITDRYYDIDYYKFTVNQQGTFTLLGGWLESNYIDDYDNRYLEIGLYDGNEVLIDYASLQTMSSGRSMKYLTEELEKGTYYLVAFQSSPYQYIFTDESYLITTVFHPNEVEAKPEILFDRAFMKKDEEKAFTAGTHSESVFASLNPSVATVDSNGMVKAVGHGETIISHTIGTEVQESVVKVSEDVTQVTTALFEEIQPANAANKNVTWKSTNKEVATVDEYGIITAIGNGEAIITVTTDDSSYEASATIEVEGEEEPEFVGDFPTMEVKPSKVFTVTFNQELDVNKDYTNDIFISQKTNRQQPVTSFTTKVDTDNPTKLFISPETEWEQGTHYLTIKKETANHKGQTLNKDVFMEFIVE